MKLKSLFNILKFVWWLPFSGMASCEMVVDIDLPPHESKLVVNCLLTPDSLVTVRVYKTLGPLDRKESVAVSNAKVVLLENSVVVDTLPFFSNPYESYYRSKHFTPQANKNYTLIVKAPGFPDAQASCTIPGKVPIQKASIRDSAGLDDGGQYFSRLLITFQDPGHVQNFYNVSGQQLYSYYTSDPGGPNPQVAYYKYPIYFFSDLNDVEDGGENGMLLKDNLFNGRQYELSLNFYPPYGNNGSGQKDTMLLAFKTVSPEYHEYYRKLQLHLYNQGGDIFSGEPVVMPSNIQNGYGIFAGYTQDTLMVVK
ncbi:DUF4249 domain-containing protein [Adhaeribacter sp. BT258]|uniref:DUF4249 domain-containing protein n=1 Tax=Adhaeribacter terrigena TaxID=2793070 RepID=A0ABS1C627_9BACT|nr:DUF4249 domain-containing protein [Adhaeribacter terrigena]MBK0404832.1 DUF4249 domain-containing protein [Adhaeribacter terrigena]